MLRSTGIIVAVLICIVVLAARAERFCNSVFTHQMHINNNDIDGIVNLFNFDDPVLCFEPGTYSLTMAQFFKHNVTLQGNNTIFDLSQVVSQAMFFLGTRETAIARYTISGITFQNAQYGPIFWGWSPGLEVHVKNCTFQSLNLGYYDPDIRSKRPGVIVLEGDGPVDNSSECSFEKNTFVDISNGDGIVLEGLCTSSRIVGNSFSGINAPQIPEDGVLTPENRFSTIRVANFQDS